MVGQKIGHYQVLEMLGAGGMGNIYKAQDPRLNRFVAIKALSGAAAGDPDRRRRFTQEAQAASALNHPNIITIHDILEENNTEYMVMEFVGGQSLADRIPRDGLGVAKTLQYGVQIADALRAAHAAGIVHRDLKPGNVMVTDTGLVKVLDFGLAKLSAQPLSEETQTLAANPLTIEGSILGTVSYMSPEQAQGRRVDARSDIFSFGALMYEMVTGQKAFSQDSTISTIASILRDEVRPIGDFANNVPAELEEIIGRALRKDPADRWQSMDEVFMMLAALKQKFDSGILAHTQILPSKPPSGRSMVGKKPPNRLVPLIAAGAAALAGVGGGALWWSAHRRAQEQAAAAQAALARAAAIQAAARQAAEAVPAQPVPPPDPASTGGTPNGHLTNNDVIAMVQAKLSPNLITSQIRASETKFDLSTAELIRLAKEGVPDRIIDVMRNPKAAPVVAPAPKSASPAASAPSITPVQATPAAPVSLPPPVAQPVAVAPPPTVTAPPTSAATSNPVVLRSVPVIGGTPFAIVLLADVPAGAEPGTPLKFRAAQDYRVEGGVVIPQGAEVTGELLGAGKKVVVFGGKTQFKLSTVTAVDGKKLHIKASPGRSDKNEHAIEPPGRKSKEVLAPAGTQYMAYFDGDQTVSVKK
jgi:serine/threonine-protein kinase